MTKQRLLYISLLIIISLSCIAYIFVIPLIPVITGYAAKKTCSCHFIANRSLKNIETYDLAKRPVNLAKNQIDNMHKTVTSSVFGLGKITAKYDEHLGCHLMHHSNQIASHLSTKNQSSIAPDGIENIPTKKNIPKPEILQLAIQKAFDRKGEWEKQTRALLVIYEDSIVLEHYSDGFNEDSKILGWSMTKSITNVLIGILVKEGKLSIKEKNLLPEWAKDNRKNITLDDLLRMSSGLRWEETYDELSPATKMLFTKEDMGAFAAEYNLEFEPGKTFEYSSGTTNILGRIIRNQFDSHEAYLAFPYDSLFNKLGLSTMILETDASGHYVFSSYAYASPRDWAKLGLLFLHDGWYKDEQILPENWVSYSTEPSVNSPNGQYGAHLWLNTNNNELKDAPASIYKFSGFEGQYVYIIPSYDAVIVRMGLSKGPPFDINDVIKTILEGIG